MNTKPLFVPQVGVADAEEWRQQIVLLLEQLISQVPLEQGVSGEWTTTDGKTITANNGIIVSIK